MPSSTVTVGRSLMSVRLDSCQQVRQALPAHRRDEHRRRFGSRRLRLECFALLRIEPVDLVPDLEDLPPLAAVDAELAQNLA